MISFKNFINKKIKFKKNSGIDDGGFTLIELLLVVVIISVLTGLVLSAINVTAMRSRARDAQRAGDLKKVQTALELYFSDNRTYPVNAGGWVRIISSGSLVLNTALGSAYIQVLPQDPRNAENTPSNVCGLTSYGYYYRTDATGARYVIMSPFEVSSTVGNNACNTLSNCSGSLVTGCNIASCAAPCYGVQNPL